LPTRRSSDLRQLRPLRFLSLGALALLDLPQARQNLSLALGELVIIDVALLQLDLQKQQLLAHRTLVVQLLVCQVSHLLKNELHPSYGHGERRAEDLEEHF